MSEFVAGKRVYWNDPDRGISSGYYKIKEIKGEIIVIEHDNGSIVEAFKKELRFY